MFLSELNEITILLASKSPRRQKLLHDLGLHYKIIELEVDETYPENLQAEEIALYLCRKKADAFNPGSLKPNTVLVTADTIVWLDGKCIGKPSGRNEAIRMLTQLAGREHSVYTGICLRTAEKEKVFFSHTLVKFNDLHESDIEFYIDNFKPYDKAGSYGIQDWIGLTGVEKVDGCYYNVMGFPVQQFYDELKKFIKA